MGNTVTNLPSSCYGGRQSSRTAAAMAAIKLIFYSGETRILYNKDKVNIINYILAGEIMFEFPDHMVCHADSFFIGHPIPALSIDDKLLAGETYFVLPLDRFGGPSSVLSVSSLLASLGIGGKPAGSVINNKMREHRRLPCPPFPCPLQYIKSSLDGRVLIKVVPEFMIKMLIGNSNTTHRDQNDDVDECNSSSSAPAPAGLICSTPELKKHYDQLVGCTKVQGWSPKLETISEYEKVRYSPCRFLGFERNLGE